MAKKAKAAAPALTGQASEPEQITTEAGPDACGHVNRHADPPQRCVLPVGHSGPHQAAYVFRKGMPDEQVLTATWLNIAGTPVDQIKEEPMPKSKPLSPAFTAQLQGPPQ